MQNVTLAQKLKDLFFGQPGNSKSIKNANVNPPSDAEIIALLSSAGEPYVSITGILTGHATTPTLVLLQNESGTTIATVTRNAAGDYDINFAANVLTENKTVVLATPQASYLQVQGSRKDVNSINVKIANPAITNPVISVTNGQITDPLINVDQGPPVTAVIANAVIAGGAAEIDDPAITNAGTDTGSVFVEIRIYNS